MTFDARRGKTPEHGSNAVFALTAIAVVTGAFFIALKFPDPTSAAKGDSSKSEHTASAQVRPRQTPAGLTSKPAKAYFETLARVDPQAAATLDKRLGKASKLPVAKQAEVVFDHASTVLKDRAVDLAKADTRHVDDILTMTRDRLRDASRANSEWCQGSRYTDLDQSVLADRAELARQFEMLEEPLRDYGFELATHLLIAVEDSEAHPVSHGPLTQTDKAAMQGVVMSMVSDPQVMPLLMAAQTGADSRELVKSLNVCDLGATAVTAIKTLPQDTKGRAFADLVRQMELGGADLGGFSQF
jgi:hypothetical protein